MSRPLLPLFLVLALASCGGAAGHGGGVKSAPVVDSCSVVLPARNPRLVSIDDKPAFSLARSTLVVNAEVPLGGVKESIEARIPKRVAEEHDQDIGVAGR